MKQLKRTKTLTQLATTRLRNAIIKNEFMFGEPLSEGLLAESMGTSKTPIREALALLKTEGLVNIFPQKGTFVFIPSLKEVKDLSELRLILESAALRLSFLRDRTALLQAMDYAIVEMNNALRINDIEVYLEFDGKLHESLFDFCDNAYLQDAYVHISGKSAALRTRISYQPNHIDKTYGEHEQFFTLVKNGEIEKALKVLKIHFSSFEQYYEKYCDNLIISDLSSTRKKRQQNKSL